MIGEGCVWLVAVGGCVKYYQETDKNRFVKHPNITVITELGKSFKVYNMYDTHAF